MASAATRLYTAFNTDSEIAMRSLLVSAILLLCTKHLLAEDWPQFRGPNCSGLSPSRGLPVKFSNKEHVRWQVSLGDGLACPVVCGGRVYSTAMTNPKTYTVFCHDVVDGREVWRRSWDAGKLPRILPQNSPASATPATDGKRLYVYLSTLGLMGLDAANGHELWRVPLPRPAYLMDWGAANSPMVYGDLVIFCQDDDLQPYVVAVEGATGKERWRTPRNEMLAGYSVPVVCTANGRTDIVIAGTGK